MPKTVLTVTGDSVSSLLNRHLKTNSDTVEIAFYELNPSLMYKEPVLEGGLRVTLPEQSESRVLKRRSVWE